MVGYASSDPALQARPTIQPRSAWTTDGWATQNGGCSNGPTYFRHPAGRGGASHRNTNDYAASPSDDLLPGITAITPTPRVGGTSPTTSSSIASARSGRRASAEPIDRSSAATPGASTPGPSVSPSSGSISRVGARPPSIRLRRWSSRCARSSPGNSVYGVDPLGTTWSKNRSSGSGMKYAAGQWVEVPTVLGHRDLGTSSCRQPGLSPGRGPARPAGPTGQQSAPPRTCSRLGRRRPGRRRPGGRCVGRGASGHGLGVGVAGACRRGRCHRHRRDQNRRLRPRQLGRVPGLRRGVAVWAVQPEPRPWSITPCSAPWAASILTADGDLVAFGGAPTNATTRPAPIRRRPRPRPIGNGYVVDRAVACIRWSAPTPAPAPRASAASTSPSVPNGRSGSGLDPSATSFLSAGPRPSRSRDPGARRHER